MSDLLIPKILTPEIFTNKGIDPVLDDIKKKVAEFNPDISSEKGRGEIKSFAYKISRSKTALDALGKDLVAGWKEKTKLVDDERKRMRDELDMLKDQIRKPLTEWEEAERNRIVNHEMNIENIKGLGINTLQQWQALPVDIIEENLKRVELYKTEEWQEFTAKANDAIAESLEKIESAIEKRNTYDKEQAELEQLRKEKVERDEKEREEAIKREAAEKARLEAERKAEQEARKKEAEAETAKAKLEQEKLRITQEKEAAERKAKEHEENLKRAKELAKKRAEEAARKEREQIEAEQEAKRQEELKREADVKHRNEIYFKIQDAFEENRIENPDVITDLLFEGKIPHITIKF